MMRDASINAFMSALLVLRVWTLDCDPSNFYANGNNDYPNTYYCADERGTWEWGTWLIGGGCLKNFNGCSCVVKGRGGQCDCVNFFDKRPNGCYSTSKRCSRCPNPGEGRVGCGCDKETNKCQDGPTCRKCFANEYSRDQTTCTACIGECDAKNMYFSTPCKPNANAVCSNCIAGSYCNDGKTATLCPENNYCPSESSAPIPCVAPKYCKGLGLSYFSLGCEEAFRYDETGCFACETGSVLTSRYIPHMIRQCTPCPPGSYANANNCHACPSGTFSSTFGSTKCDVCLAGSYSLSAATECTQCNPGFFTSNSQASACIACDAGKYSSIKGASICNTCAGGTYSVSSACVQCDAGKTTFTQDMYAKDGASSAAECRLCPNGTFACTACPYTAQIVQDRQCENEKCYFGDYQVYTYVPCVPCGANSTHYCTNGRRIVRTQPVIGATFNLRPARDGNEDNIIVPCTICGAGTYAFVRCTTTRDTVCRKCTNPRWLIERISRNCTPMTDTVIVSCNQKEMAAVGGVCNPCPPGSRLNASGCALIQPQCPQGMVSGLGSRGCTVRCPAGQVAPDGITCGKLQTRAINANNVVSFESVAYYRNSFIGVQNFMMVGRGALWHQDGTTCLAGDTTQPGVADGGSARFGRIGGVVAFGDGGIMLTEPDLGTVRLLSKTFEATTMISRGDWSPGALARYRDRSFEGFLITDARRNCVWKVLGGNRSVMWPDITTWKQPTRISVYDDNTTFVMDSAAIWKIKNNALEKVCGDYYSSADSLTSCAQLNLIKMGVFDMAVGAIGTNATVALLTRFNRLLLLDLNTRAIRLIPTTNGSEITAILWPNRLFIVVGSNIIREADIASCACDDGLYCLQGQCVIAPTGTYASAWKPPAPCPQGSAPNLQGDCAPCPMQPAFTTFSPGSLNCIFYGEQSPCGGGKYRQSVLLGGGCAACPLGTYSSGYDCVPYPAGTTAASKPCPSAIFDGQFSCRNDSVSDRVQTFENITDIAVTAGGVVFVATGNALWRGAARLCVGIMDIIAVADDETTFFHASYGGTVLYRNCVLVREGVPPMKEMALRSDALFIVSIVSGRTYAISVSDYSMRLYMSTFTSSIASFYSELYFDYGAANITIDGAISSMCATNKFSAIATGNKVLVFAKSGNMESSNVFPSSVVAVGCAGRWVWAATANSVRAIQTQSVACLGGYAKGGEACVPVGLGRYTDANGTVFRCSTSRVYGSTDAAASESIACRECPNGIGGVLCTPCPMFVSEGRCVDECPVPQLQRGACGAAAVEKVVKSWETATVVVGLHINGVAASEVDSCVYYSNMDRLYYLLSDDVSFELCRVGTTIVSLATNVDGSIVFAVASDGAVYRFPVSKSRTVNVDETVKTLMAGAWKIATVDGGYKMTLMPNALVVTRRNLTSEMIFLSNLTMKPYKNGSPIDNGFSITGNGRVIVRGNETIAGSLRKSGWNDGIPMVSLLSNAMQLAYERLTGAVYVADLGNGLRRIMQVAASSIKQGTVYQNEAVTFARVLSLQPQEDTSGDWYGFPAPISFSWDDIFRPDSMVKYRLLPSKIAPIVTMTRFGSAWAIDRSFMVQPRRVMPGVWFPCNASCQNTVASFAPATTPDQIWHSIRIEAYMNNALTVSGSLSLSIIAGPPRTAMSSQPQMEALGGTERIGAWSRYIIIGSRVQHISNVPDGSQAVRVDSIGWPSHYACPDGYMWLGGGNITCLSCLPGTYSKRTETKGGPYRCTACHLGTHSTAVGSTTCLSCPPGTYADIYGATACTPCASRGMWTYPGAQSAHACGFCSPGSANCTNCVAGQYQNNPGQKVCLQCDAGSYSSVSGATTCQPCAAQTYQPMRGKSVCDPCPTATLAGAKVCDPCPRNPHCSLAINAVCGRGCGLNKYYNDATKLCTMCPEKSLNAYAQCAMDVSACWIPAQNLYYYENANTGVISVMSCQPGYEVTENKNGCQPSSAGNYANANSSGRCGEGTFSSARASTTCTFCSDGKFSDGGINTVCLACVPGTFSAGVGASACTRCYAGSFSTGLGAMSCTHCMQGKWSVGTGRASDCDSFCAEGTVSASGATACMACAAGTFAKQSTCVGCGLGYYYFQDRCVQCPQGLANTKWPYASNSSACAPCDDARFKANEARDACLRLPPGNIMVGGNAVMCPIGTSRANDDYACIPCSAGTWASRPGQSQCPPCPVGTFGTSKGCVKCQQHTMTDAVAATVCETCAPGSEASPDGTSCIPCPANHYHVMGVGCQACGTNMISPAGSTVCTRCPEWTTSPDCGVCQPGQYMDVYENNYYCATCPIGTHNPMHGSRSISDCVACEAQGYVPDASAAGCTPCPPGYSSLNAYECTPCTAGTFSQDGIVCIPCGTGSFSPAPLAAMCIQCPAGSRGLTVGLTECTPCPPGTFGVGCEPCPIGTFQPNSGAVSCLGRRKWCGAGEYIRVSSAPDRDDTCEFCLPCPENSYTVDGNNNEYIGNAKCLGNTTNPPYRCVINDWKAGEYLASSSNRAGTMLTASVRTSLSCDPIDKKKRMRYVVGPTFDCFIGCKHGLNSGGVDKYAAIFVNTKDRPRDNIFLYKNAIAYASQLCAPCPLGQCGLGLYRPVDTEDATCGDPRGCVGICDEPPANAVTTGGSRELGNRTCPWSCKLGYHLSDDGSMCVSCSDASQCDGNSVLLPKTKCDPETRTHQLCRACRYIEGGTPVGWDGGCVYECAWGYYPPLCAPCQNMTCPVGTYLDSTRCFVKKLPPRCVSCTIGSDRATFTSAGDENMDNCMGRCKPGFRPIEPTELAAALKCQPCVDGEPCQGRCHVGSFKNSTTGKCNPCTLSPQCPIGKYAPVCDDAMADPGCHNCPNAPPRNAMFVPNKDYTMDAALLIGAPCAIACQHNHVELSGECVPCSEYWKRTTSNAHDYEIFSHWNATPDATTKSRRSGRCFQCPLGFGVLPGDTDLCTILPGFGDAAAANSIVPIPSLGQDIYLIYKDPLPSIGFYGPRRLLLEAGNAMSDLIKECPVAYYNDRTSEQCRECPSGTSTYTVGSRSIEDCKCIPGHYAVGVHCEPCPIDTFLGKQDVMCNKCPEGETTFGKTGSTACGCAPGSVRQGDGCVQCAANTFCYPCLDTQPDCIQQFDCFSLGISPPGSTSLKNCSCMTGMTKLKRHTGDPALASSYYCVRPPPNSVSDGTSISCKRGWTSVWEKSQLIACTLCSPGYYYYSSIADDFLGGTCLPCPLGSYTGVSDTVGACTTCPSGSIGKRQAATSVEDGCEMQSILPPGKCPGNAVMILGACLCDKGFYRVGDTTLVCAPCPIGSFSSHVSNTCSRCPEGATTATVGATRRGLCGATEDLCLKPAYAFIGPGMCRRM